MDEVNVEAVRAVMAAARECALEMLENANYIQAELPNVEMPDELREMTERVCSELIGTKHDVISELSELEDLLEGEAPREEVDKRTSRIVAWLGDDINKLNELVSALHAAKEEDPSHSLAWVLVAESASNIFGAFAATAEAADEIHAEE
jgi:hypothetical protein